MFTLLAEATANATAAKIEKLTKEKVDLQSKINVLEANVKSLKMQNDVLADQVKNTESKIDIAISAATGKVRETLEKEVQAVFERGQKFMLQTIQTAKNTLF